MKKTEIVVVSSNEKIMEDVEEGEMIFKKMNDWKYFSSEDFSRFMKSKKDKNIIIVIDQSHNVGKNNFKYRYSKEGTVARELYRKYEARTFFLTNNAWCHCYLWWLRYGGPAHEVYVFWSYAAFDSDSYGIPGGVATALRMKIAIMEVLPKLH